MSNLKSNWVKQAKNQYDFVELEYDKTKLLAAGMICLSHQFSGIDKAPNIMHKFSIEPPSSLLNDCPKISR